MSFLFYFPLMFQVFVVVVLRQFATKWRLICTFWSYVRVVRHIFIVDDDDEHYSTRSATKTHGAARTDTRSQLECMFPKTNAQTHGHARRHINTVGAHKRIASLMVRVQRQCAVCAHKHLCLFVRHYCSSSRQQGARVTQNTCACKTSTRGPLKCFCVYIINSRASSSSSSSWGRPVSLALHSTVNYWLMRGWWWYHKRVDNQEVFIFASCVSDGIKMSVV